MDRGEAIRPAREEAEVMVGALLYGIGVAGFVVVLLVAAWPDRTPDRRK